MLSQKNITHVVVGKDLALLTSSQTRADLVAGTIGVFKNGSSTATTDALSAGDRFKVVFKNVDGKIIESPFFDYSNIVSKKAVNYASDTEQKTTVGFNGTSGSIAVNNSSDYYIHLDRKDSSKTWGEYTLYKMVAAYKSDASATETEIAWGLLANAVKNLAVEKRKGGYEVTRVGIINSNAAVTTNDFAGNCTVVKGVAAMTVASSGQYATNTDVVVGDYIRLGATTATAITVSANVYKVTAISGTTTKVYTLDRPVSEPSGTYSTGTGTEVIPKATAEAANWGLTFTSLPVKFVPGLFKNQQVTFDINLSDAFGATAVTTVTTPSKGSGTYEEVAEIEWLLAGNRGEPFRVASYPVNKNLNAVSGKTYDTISLVVTNNNSTDIDHEVKSWIGLTIFTEDESSYTAHTTLKTVLGIS